MIDAQETIESLIHDYPTLFGKRIDVLNQLFLVYGNGMHWKDGEPVNRICNDCEDVRRENCRWCNEEKPTTINQDNIFHRSIDYSSSQRLFSIHVNYSMISKVPADVTPSWRIEILWLLDEIISGKSVVRKLEGEYGAELNPVRRAKIIQMALKESYVNVT